jgi:hypothetical protein
MINPPFYNSKQVSSWLKTFEDLLEAKIAASFIKLCCHLLRAGKEDQYEAETIIRTKLEQK